MASVRFIFNDGLIVETVADTDRAARFEDNFIKAKTDGSVFMQRITDFLSGETALFDLRDVVRIQVQR